MNLCVSAPRHASSINILTGSFVFVLNVFVVSSLEQKKVIVRIMVRTWTLYIHNTTMFATIVIHAMCMMLPPLAVGAAVAPACAVVGTLGDDVGVITGLDVGPDDGESVSAAVGPDVGEDDGVIVGPDDGSMVGPDDGIIVGSVVGATNPTMSMESNSSLSIFNTSLLVSRNAPAYASMSSGESKAANTFSPMGNSVSGSSGFGDLMKSMPTPKASTFLPSAKICSFRKIGPTGMPFWLDKRTLTSLTMKLGSSGREARMWAAVALSQSACSKGVMRKRVSSVIDANVKMVSTGCCDGAIDMVGTMVGGSVALFVG